MDFQSFINIVLPVALTIVGWFSRELWTAVQGLKEDVSRLREELPSKYVSKADFNDRWEEVLKAIHRIEDKLDRLNNQ